MSSAGRESEGYMFHLQFHIPAVQVGVVHTSYPSLNLNIFLCFKWFLIFPALAVDPFQMWFKWEVTEEAANIFYFARTHTHTKPFPSHLSILNSKRIHTHTKTRVWHSWIGFFFVLNSVEIKIKIV